MGWNRFQHQITEMEPWAGAGALSFNKPSSSW